MESAVKALMIAATTILGMLLLSIMIYMFRSAAKVDEQYDSNQSQLSLELDNSQFEYYNRPYNTIMDLISLANLVYSNNVENNWDAARAVNLKINIEGKILKYQMKILI